jgi:hypothetical protein
VDNSLLQLFWVMYIKFWLKSLKGKENSEDLDVVGRTISNGYFGNGVGGCGLDSSGSR